MGPVPSMLSCALFHPHGTVEQEPKERGGWPEVWLPIHGQQECAWDEGSDRLKMRP